jgi:cytidylate kinase
MIPVIAIDGPSASGKGTVAQRVADALGFHYLDSGSLYRLTALAAFKADIPLDDAKALTALAGGLRIRFENGEIFLSDHIVTEDIRSELCGNRASRVAAIPAVRSALLTRQRGWRRAPGLVADGRDMGTVVFPDAKLKVFLTASVEARAVRRYNQLKDKGNPANMADLLRDIAERDLRDQTRAVAPLQKGMGAQLLDTTQLTINQAVDQVLEWAKSALASPS